MSNQVSDDSVYLRIRNAKKTIVLELKSTQIVNDVKQEIAEVLEVSNKEFVKIYRETEPLDDVKSLKNCNITPESAKPHLPFELNFALRDSEDQEFSPPELEQYSSPQQAAVGE
jgi:hypothetical protein